MTMHEPNKSQAHDKTPTLNYQAIDGKKQNAGMGKVFVCFMFGASLGGGVSFVILVILNLIMGGILDPSLNLLEITSPYIFCLSPASALLLLLALVMRRLSIPNGGYVAPETALIWGIAYVVWMPIFITLPIDIRWILIVGYWCHLLWMIIFPVAAAFWLYRRDIITE